MNEMRIDHGIHVGNNITARIIGTDGLKIGSRLWYPNGRIVSIVGIGSGRFGSGVCEVLLSGDIDETQNKILLQEPVR